MSKFGLIIKQKPMRAKGVQVKLVFIFILLGILPNTTIISQIDTLFICNPGDPVQLSAPEGTFIYQWTPNFNLDNPTIFNPIANPTIKTTYIAKMISSAVDQNLIANPAFEDGNNGFTSDYNFVDLINTQGTYGINESAANLNGIFFDDCPDHTTGDGLMLIVDGSPRANEQVWCQNISVSRETNYAFTAWLTSVNPMNPPALQFSINTEPLGEIFRGSSQVCEWRPFFETWYSDTTTQAEICIINQNTNPTGNDFAMDDFAFYRLEEVIWDTTVVIIEALEAATQRNVYFPNTFSPNGDGINDAFKPFTGKGVEFIRSFQIFNRWGSLIYEAQNCRPDEARCAWDGNFQGEPAATGVYLYLCQITFADLQMVGYSGEIRLLR